MRERGHVFNAFCLGIGIGILLVPSITVETAKSVLAVDVPVTLGALLPDLDTSFGDHRVHGHNLLLLATVLAFPIAFGNLAWVWLGVLTHYVLDLLGNVRGMALFYPFSRDSFDVPVGVPVDSRWADVATIGVTALELTIAVAAVVWIRDGTIQLPTEVVTLANHLV